MSRAWAVSCVLVAVAVPAAIGCGGGGEVGADARPVSPELRGLAARARELVDVDPAALGYRLRLAAASGDLRARTDADARTITLFLRPRDAAHRVAHDLAHEVGHAYDLESMSDAARVEYLRGRGAADTPWWPGGRRSDLEVGAGDFAEVFALCHAASPEFRSRVAPRPDDACASLPQGARRSMR